MKKIIRHNIFFYILILFITSYSFSQEINSSDNKAIFSLINKFSDKDPFVNGEAIDLLVNYGNSAVDYLIKSLEDESDNVRWCSAIALGKFHNAAETSVNALFNLLNDDNRDVRWAAYISLSKINKEAINKRPEFSRVIEILEKLTPKLIKKLNVPGVSISIIKNYKLSWSKSFGISDAVQQNKVNNKTIFEACSMSKPVFTFLVLKLADQGKLDLDKPLSEYLPEQFVSDNDDYSKLITARMILTHTGGTPNWRKGGEERGGPIPIYFKPGTKFNYSGEGIYYLQKVVEQITQEPLETYARRNLFDRLGFESTSFIWTEKLNPQIATGHDTLGNCNKRSNYKHSNASYTLYTTPDEYAKFLIEIIKQNNPDEFSLSKRMTNEMLKHQIRVDVRDVVDRPGRSLGLFSFRGLGFRCYSQ